MMHRIRYALSNATFETKLGGTVEADETWVGGTVRGKGQAYKGNKTPVVALVERKGKVRSQVVEQVTGNNIDKILRKNVSKKATLMTDEFRGYRKPGKRFAKHESVNHSAGEYVRGNAHTNTVEGYFSILKRGIIGVYHHVGRQHLNKYLSEFDFRYNTRTLTDGDRTISGIKKVEGKRLVLKPCRSNVV